MGRKLRTLLCGAFLVAVFSGQVGASPAFIGPGAFVGPTEIDFTGIANEALITNQFAGSGVTFSGALYGLTNDQDLAMFPLGGEGVVASNWIYPNVQAQGLSFTADFGSPQKRVGFYLETWPIDVATIELFSGQSSLGSLTYSTTSLNTEFVGIQDLSGFDRLVFTNTVNQNGFYAIDDFQFEADGPIQNNPVHTPEPASLLLIGTGLLGLRLRNVRRP